MKRLRAINARVKPVAEPPLVGQRVSRLRQLLGDEPFDFVAVPKSKYDEARGLFPEAWITITDEK